MRLLVSVESTWEALAALDGGADLIDAKDPRSGALGAVSLTTLADIHDTVAGRRPVTAALGDAADESATEQRAHDFARAGAEFVKVGFAGITNLDSVRALTCAAVRGAGAGRDGAGVVAVAYADADSVGSIRPSELIAIASATGATGVLIDTAEKSGPGLRELVDPNSLARWVADARAAGLFVALAGKLSPEDLDYVRDAGADIAGVRGAACTGGRTGQVDAGRVRLLKQRTVRSLTAV